MVKKITTTQGYKRNKLTLISFSHKIKGYIYWNVVCDCGTEKQVRLDHFFTDKSKSCGCLRGADRSGLSETPEYKAWSALKRRCSPNGSKREMKDYFLRGITVCKEWDDFFVFLKDMGRRPSSKHSIDRINNDLGYFKENCRWATASEQMQNRRNKNKYRGVWFLSSRGLYESALCFNGKKYYVGRFATDIEAAIAYDKKVREVIGEKGIVNFKDGVL